MPTLHSGHAGGAPPAPSLRAAGPAALLLGLGLVLLACVAAAQPTPGRPQGPPLRAGLEQNPPLSFMTPQGEAAGVLVDVLEEVARQEGWRIEYCLLYTSDAADE